MLSESNLFEKNLGNAMCYKYSEGEIFPEQAASDANLTATGGYFFGHLVTKKKSF